MRLFILLALFSVAFAPPVDQTNLLNTQLPEFSESLAQLSLGWLMINAEKRYLKKMACGYTAAGVAGTAGSVTATAFTGGIAAPLIVGNACVFGIAGRRLRQDMVNLGERKKFIYDTISGNYVDRSFFDKLDTIKISSMISKRKKTQKGLSKLVNLLEEYGYFDDADIISSELQGRFSPSLIEVIRRNVI